MTGKVGHQVSRGFQFRVLSVKSALGAVEGVARFANDVEGLFIQPSTATMEPCCACTVTLD